MSAGRVTIRRAAPAEAQRPARFARQTLRDAFQAGNTLEDMDVYCGIAFAGPLPPEQIADAAIAMLLAENGPSLT